MDPKPARRAGYGVPFPVIEPGHTYRTITEKISAIVLTKPHPIAWFVFFGLGFLLVNVLTASIAYLFLKGVGIWGVDIPVASRYLDRVADVYVPNLDVLVIYSDHVRSLIEPRGSNWNHASLTVGATVLQHEIQRAVGRGG